MKRMIRMITRIVCTLTVVSFVLLTTDSYADQKVYNWKFNSLWPSGFALYESDKHFVETVNKLSNGRLRIRLYASGQMIPGHQNIDAVQRGTMEMAGDFGSYWAGRNTAFDLLGTTPMGMTWVDYMLWIYHGGGQKIYDQMYGEYNIKWLLGAFTPVESGFRTNVPINSLDDFKGLKLRMGSLFGQRILERLGASAIMLDGGEIFEAVSRGVVDGAEFSIPIVDWSVGFQNITKYWSAPAWYQTAIVLGIMINEKAWNSLPDDLKDIVVQASRATTAYMSSWYAYKNIEATEKFKAAGIKMTHLDDASMEKLQTIINSILEEEAEKNPDFAKVLKSQIKYMKDYEAVRSYEHPYTFGFNPKSYPEVP